jgi:hypothetical protein
MISPDAYSPARPASLRRQQPNLPPQKRFRVWSKNRGTAALSLMMRFIAAIPPSKVRPRDFVDLSTRESRDPHPQRS